MNITVVKDWFKMTIEQVVIRNVFVILFLRQ